MRGKWRGRGPCFSDRSADENDVGSDSPVALEEVNVRPECKTHGLRVGQSSNFAINENTAQAMKTQDRQPKQPQPSEVSVSLFKLLSIA